jgi:hypothetical protein
MKLRNACLLILVCMFTVLSGCVKKEGVSTENYNDLVKRYNDLKNQSYTSSEAALKVERELVELDLALYRFSSNAEKYLNSKTLSSADKKQLLSDIAEGFKAGLELIARAETSILKEIEELEANADRLYQHGKARFAILKKLDATLQGIRAEHGLIMNQVEREAQANQADSTPNPAPIAERTDKAIVFTPEVRAAGQAPQGGGLYRNGSGHLMMVEPDRIVETAKNMGYRHDVVRDGFKMARDNGGVVGLACSNPDLIRVLNDLVSHMKTEMNKNSDDLELAFAIDYSGSMNNNIREVLNRVSEFSRNLEDIKASGRAVKVAIVTYGEPTHEKIELSLTEDLFVFRSTLKRLLDEYGSKTHSTDPGEAIYMGLEKLVDQVGFRSQNRQIIAITDEGSYELGTGRSDIVARVEQKLKSFHLYPLIVRLCD